MVMVYVDMGARIILAGVLTTFPVQEQMGPELD